MQPIATLIVFLVQLSLAAAWVQHEAPDLPTAWRVSNHPVPDDQVLVLYFSLKQSRLGELLRITRAVSNPKSTLYGKYRGRAEIESLTRPSDETINVVERWLREQGKFQSRIIGGHVLEVSLTTRDATRLLHTSFHYVSSCLREHPNIIRAGDFWLPSEVHNVVSAVYGLHGLPLSQIAKPKPAQNATRVTPAVLKRTYDIQGVTPSASNRSRQAVAAFIGETLNMSDLQAFFETYVANVNSSLASIYRFVGNTSLGSSGDETALDLEYIMGVAPGVLTEMWYYGGFDFCKDIMMWAQELLASDDAPLVHSISYGGQGNLSLMGCGLDYVKDVDISLMKLAARGYTIIVASGDVGAGYQPSCTAQKDTAVKGNLINTLPVDGHIPPEERPAFCCSYAVMRKATAWTMRPYDLQCLVFNGTIQTVHEQGSQSGGAALFPNSQTLWPSWPASSPWVTAVGSTQFAGLMEGQEQVATKAFGSGGGFSNMFPMFEDQTPAINRYMQIAPQLPPQGAFAQGGRGTPDLSVLGDHYVTIINGDLSPAGGTSASAPVFAAMVSLINDARLQHGKPPMGYLNPWLYSHLDMFTDVTHGHNAIDRRGSPAQYGFNCTAGWDPVTGLGVPVFSRMLESAMHMADAQSGIVI